MPPGPTSVTVLLPAHNEAATIELAIRSLQDQSRPPSRIVVVADNCTDRTAEIALEVGAEVIETVANTDKKAGGLNQALARLLPDAGPQDAFMIMDADTAVAPLFLEVAVGYLELNEHLGAVGGLFYGEGGGGLVGALQRNEYLRYGREIAVKQGRVSVLSGTASVFRAVALAEVATARGDRLPGTPGLVYDTFALTEDNELTLALKSLGWAMVSPQECHNVTEVMPTWGDLWRQRVRWQRGAVENLRTYGWTPVTRRYWFQQVGLAYGVLALQLYLALMVLTVLGSERWIVYPFWLVVGLLFLAERVVTVWRGGWLARLVAAPLVIELVYDMVIQAVFLKVTFDLMRGKQAQWHHVQRAPGAAS